MKHIKNKTKTKEVDFLDDKVEIKQLSVAAVMALQEELQVEDDVESIGTMGKVIRAGVVDAEDMSDEDLHEFPLAELIGLVTKVTEYAGLKAESGND